ncbi:M42 family metallopeptidase [Anaerocolumna sp.]|uniref:M42 family metallopeptidase n=1 Tax=Anaerocolumna sp. TaxID=2041569 RepID=UPI0028AD2B7C|nr:M20/M25/M40 family metallo-hydrolase [Anaerocolumna sp.]
MLEELTKIWGVSGREKRVANYIIDQIVDYADEIKKDAMGNLIALKKGNGINKKKIMTAAHMDEIGLCVVKIMENGLLLVKNVGGVSPYISFMNRVQFANGVTGCVACKEKIQKVEPNEMNKLYIDIGAKDKAEAEQYIQVGDCAMFLGEYTKLLGNNVMSKAFDDRSACFIQIETMKRMKTPYHDVYFVFTVQEEVGLFGSTTSAEGIQPDLGIAIDITGAFDIPGDEFGNPVLGGGAAIKVNDASVICDEALTQDLIDCAKNNNINYQLDALPAGGTDAGAITKSNAGVKVLGISIPTRYGHSPNSIINLADVEACIQLLIEFVEMPLNIVTEEIIK